jgi:hypothetical protein
MGLAGLAAMAVPAFLSLLALCRLESARAIGTARRAALATQVEAQVDLVRAGEKPLVTPTTLTVRQTSNVWVAVRLAEWWAPPGLSGAFSTARKAQGQDSPSGVC